MITKRAALLTSILLALALGLGPLAPEPAAAKGMCMEGRWDEHEMHCWLTDPADCSECWIRPEMP